MGPQGGHWQHALFLFEDMGRRGLVQSEVAFSEVVAACEKGGQFHQALALLMRRAGFQVRASPAAVPHLPGSSSRDQLVATFKAVAGVFGGTSEA